MVVRFVKLRAMEQIAFVRSMIFVLLSSAGEGNYLMKDSTIKSRKRFREEGILKSRRTTTNSFALQVKWVLQAFSATLQLNCETVRRHAAEVTKKPIQSFNRTICIGEVLVNRSLRRLW